MQNGETSVAGLSSAEVAERLTRGDGNEVPEHSSRSYRDIVQGNVFTRFNALLAALAAVVLVVGNPIDALFALVLVFNTVIGIFQEVRAKRTLDRLRILIAPTVAVRRDGALTRIDPAALVLDDVVELQAGDQVPVDGRVLDAAGLELDESALTGESDPIPKQPDDEVLAGSTVLAGGGSVQAIRVGEHTGMHRLVTQAKQFVLTRSELRAGIDQILRYVEWGLLPLGALLLWSQLRSTTSSGGSRHLSDALVSAVAGVVGLIPQGLVLLVSMAMAVAIMRLARNHVVVQELYAVEGLARVDVLCVDKTGTLTTGEMQVASIEPLSGSEDDALAALAALAAAEPSPTTTMKVLADRLPPDPGWTAGSQVAFSSARKWSGTTFDGHGSWLLGAPEILLAATGGDGSRPATARIAELATDARRVLLLAHSDAALATEGTLPAGLEPVALIVLSETVRPDAADTMAFFARQSVTIKVISGDNPQTVSAVATGIGVAGAERFVDLREHSAPFDELVEANAVFGRVLPEQKRELVEALQRAGHVVAMTGDGVNDIPALKKADIGIAMDTATAATKAVSQLVLLDGRFDRLPNVVAEGRRVVANMERVSSLFVTKTVYATLFALVIGVSGAVFPFLPRHMSLTSELTIGVPAFVLSFRSANAPCRPGFLRRILRFALPTGCVAAAVALGAYWLSRSPILDGTLAQSRTASTLALATVGFWVLYRLMRPLDRFGWVLLGLLVVAFAAIVLTPPLRHFYALAFPPWRDALATAALVVGSLTALEFTLRIFRR